MTDITLEIIATVAAYTRASNVSYIDAAKVSDHPLPDVVNVVELNCVSVYEYLLERDGSGGSSSPGEDVACANSCILTGCNLSEQNGPSTVSFCDGKKGPAVEEVSGRIMELDSKRVFPQ